MSSRCWFRGWGNADSFIFGPDGTAYNPDGTAPGTQTVLVKSSDKIPVTQYTITLERYGKLTTS